jgi:hypothetical protein
MQNLPIILLIIDFQEESFIGQDLDDSNAGGYISEAMIEANSDLHWA